MDHPNGPDMSAADRSFASALALHKAGAIEEAALAYATALAAEPGHLPSLLHLGALRLAQSQPDAARQLFTGACARHPQSPEAHANLAMALQALNQHDAALASYERSLTLKPDFFDAHYGLGMLLQAMGRPEAAVARFEVLLEIAPDHAEAHHARAGSLHALGRFEDAIAGYRDALAADADFAEAHQGIGAALHAMQRYDAAVDAYRQALELDPDYADAHCGIGMARRAQGQHQEAVDAYTDAVRAEPEHLGARLGLADTLLAMKAFEQAKTAFETILEAYPTHPKARCGLGWCLFHLDRPAEAVEQLEPLAREHPDFTEAHSRLGVALFALDQPHRALAPFERSLALNPTNGNAALDLGICLVALNRQEEALRMLRRAAERLANPTDAIGLEGLTMLALGDFQAGWAKYEERFFHKPLPPEVTVAPRWRGEEIRGKTILLYAEQGLGDMIQYARYAPLVAAKGARVLLGVPEPLQALFATLRGCQVFPGGKLDLDVHCPFGSLPLAFGTDLASIPANIPYLWPDPAKVEAWRRRLGPRSKPRIGIAWSGNPTFINDLRRSMPLARLEPLLARSDLEIHVAQRDIREADRAYLATAPQVVDHSAELVDFAETAALLSLMDVVVSVDTSVAHLAGALGRRLFVLLAFSADWRWMRDRTDNPWYPTARLFRQTAPGGDWSGAVASVCAALTEELGGEGGTFTKASFGPLTFRLSPSPPA